MGGYPPGSRGYFARRANRIRWMYDAVVTERSWVSPAPFVVAPVAPYLLWAPGTDADDLESVELLLQRYDFSWTGGRETFIRRRAKAAQRFLADYALDWHEPGARRYLPATLPDLPFADRTFAVALVPNLLLSYVNLFDLPWHLAAIRRLTRVAREVRVHPVTDTQGRHYDDIAGLTAELAAGHRGGSAARGGLSAASGAPMDTGLSPLRVSRQGQGHPHTRKIPLAGGTLMLAPHPVAPPSAHQLLVFLLQLGLLLALALALGRLATRLRMPAVAGELCAGVLLGPSLLDNLAPGVAGWMFPKDPAQIHLLDAFGQIGVLLLVGVAGIQLDFGLVRRHGLTAARISIAGLVIPLAFGIGCGFVLPASFMVDTADRGVFALFLGVAMCVSAIPVIAKTLMDMGLLHRNIGQLTLAAGMVDDAFGWLLLSIVSGLATVGMIATKAMLSLSYLLGVILIAWLAARPLVRIVLRAACRSREPGTQISAVIVMILLSAAATHALGLEPIFGAFTCGVLIGTSEVMRPADLVPLRTMVLVFLAPVFFATAGLRTDFTALGRPLVLGAALLVLSTAVVGKFAGAFVGARLSRLGRWEAIALGAGMNARGVIEIVVATVGLRIGVLTTETYTIVVLVAIATSLMAPPILRSAMRRVEQPAEERARAETFALPMRAE